LSEEVNVLQGRVSNLQVGEHVLVERLRRSEEKIKALKKEVDLANEMLDSSKKQIVVKDHEISRLSDQLHELNDAYRILNNQFLEEENNKATLESKSYSMERSLNDTMKDREQLLDMINLLKNDLKTAKAERMEAVMSKERIERAWSSMERDVDSYRKALEDLAEELREAKHSAVVSSIQIEDLESKLDNQERLASLYQSDLQTAKSELDQTRKDFKDVSQKLMAHQSSTNNADIINQMREDIKDLRKQSNDLLEDKQRLARERDHLHSQLHALSSTEENRRLMDSQSQQEQSSLYKMLEEKDQAINSLTQQNLHLRHDMELLQHELKDQGQTCGSLSAAVKDKEIMMSQRQDSYQKLQSEYNLLTNRYTEANLSNSNLTNQNQSLSSSLSRAQDRLGELEKDNKSLNEQLLLMQGDHDRIKLEYDTIQRHLSSLERRQELSRDDIHVVQEEKESLSVELAQLRSLIATMEISAKNQQGKIQQLLSNLDDEVENGKELSKANERLNERIHELTHELQSNRRTMHLLDEERDQLQAEYDDKVEDLRRCDDLKLKLESQCSQLRQLVDSLERKLSDAGNDIATSQRHHASYESRIQALLYENNELKKRLKAKMQEVSGAAHDLNLMTQENQALTSELASSTSECDSLRQRLSEVLSINSQSEQMKRALEIERDDLLETYRSVIVEKKKLENDLQALG
jgi:chromosome segregation ATPase